MRKAIQNGEFIKTWVSVFLLIFMILIFGPTEVFFGNYTELNFVYGEFGWVFMLAGVGISLVLALLLMLLPSRFRDFIVALLWGISIAGYIQIMFLNKQLQLIGLNADGPNATTQQIVMNAVLWGAIMIFAIVLALFKPIFGKKVILWSSVVLLGMQLVGMVSLFVGADKRAFQYEDEELCLDMNGQLTVSAEDNLIIILFDNCANQWLAEARGAFPNMLDCMRDFTYYNNADCNYYGTYPSVAHILTGNPVDVSLTTNEYLAQSWDNDRTNSFYDLLKENKYKVNLYLSQPEVIVGTNSMEILTDKVDNITNKGDQRDIYYKLLYKTMIQMSCYRFAPVGLKPEFYVSNEQYAGIVSYPGNEMAYSNYAFYDKLLTDGITVDDSGNYFVYNHLNGSHEFVNDEACHYNPNVDRNQTICGMFVLLDEYLRQLQELGVYDNSTIIVMTDHGAGFNAQPIFFVKEKNVHQDKMVESNAPISFDELLPTFVQAIGEDPEDFGDTIYIHEDGEWRERVFYDRALSNQYDVVHRYDGLANGSANVYTKYTYTGDYWYLRSEIEKGAFEELPMADSFY